MYDPLQYFHQHVIYCIKNNIFLNHLVYRFENIPVLEEMNIDKKLWDIYLSSRAIEMADLNPELQPKLI